MEIDSAIQQRLTYTNQIHLLAYWSDLNDEQRQTLLHDVSEVDFDRVQQAYDAIKHELSDETSDKKDEATEVIDDVMEPIPDHMAGSIDETSQEQLDEYRLKGLNAIAEGNVCVLLLAGGQGTRLGRVPIISCDRTHPLALQVWIIPKGCSALVYRRINRSIRSKRSAFFGSNKSPMSNAERPAVEFHGSCLTASSSSECLDRLCSGSS